MPRQVLRTVAMVGAGSLAVFGGVTAAHAAPGDESNASGTFLSGSILDLIPLGAVVNLEGASATNGGTTPVGDATEFNTFDLTALGLVNVSAPNGVQIPIDIGSLGVLGQYASAAPDGSSVGASGAIGAGGAIGNGVPPAPGTAPGPLSVSLNGVVDSLAGSLAAGLVDELATVSLTVDAVSARASQAAPDAPVGDYTIAGSELVIGSQTVAGLTGAVNAAVLDLQSAVDALQADLNTSLSGVLSLAGGVVDLDLTVDTASLTDAVSGLLTGTLTDPAYPGVSVDLGTGQITVDLAEILDLNNLAVGQELLSGTTVQYVEDAVFSLLSGLTGEIEAAVTSAIRGLGVDGGASINLGFLGTLPLLTIDTTVGELLDGDTSGVALLGIPLPLPFGLAQVVAALTAPLNAIVSEASALTQALLVPVNDLLLPALDAVLPLAASLTANNQSTSPEGVFSETALILTVLPGIAPVTLALATATVGPNALDDNTDVTITAPTAGQQFVVPDEDDTTDVVVSGGGQPGAVVTVAVPGQAAQTATVGIDGTWTTAFLDLPVGAYTATATQNVDGTTATVDFAVAPAPDVVITVPIEGAEITVPDEDDLADVTVSGTGAAGAEIEVVADGETQTATVTPEGTWTATFDDLPVGDYTATATQDIDGSTDTVSFSVAAAADVVITQPTDGDEFVVDDADDTASVAISGTGDPGAEVTVTVTGQDPQTVTVGPGGTWTAPFDTVPVGGYTATATQSTDGSTSSIGFTVVAATDVVITAPEDGEEILVADAGDTADVEVAGSGQPGAEVVVTIPGQPAQTVTVGTDGDWSATFPGLPEGDYTATAAQDDGSSDTVSFSVAAAADVVITAPVDGTAFPVADADDTQDVTVSGSAQPGAEVTVAVPGFGEETVTADASTGAWSVVFDGLPVGDYTATATQDADDSTSTVDFSVVEIVDVEIASPVDGVAFVVDGPTDVTDVTVSGTGAEGATVTVDLPGVAAPTAVVTGGAWSVTIPGVPVGAYTATATQDADGSTDTVSFEVVEATDVLILQPGPETVVTVPGPDDTTDLPVSGTGQPGAEVTVTVADLDPVTTTVEEDGSWSVIVPDVPVGEHTVTASQDDGSSASVVITVEEAADVTITAPTPGQVIPVDDTGDLATVVVTGTGQPGATVTVAIPGLGDETATVTPGGTWTATFEDVPEGEHTATVTQDADDSTAEVTFSVEAIDDVVITEPAAGEELTVPAAGDLIDVVVSGTAQPGGAVEVELTPGGATETATVTPEGTWTVTFEDVAVGDYTATATQDADGSSDDVSFSVAVEGAADADATDADATDADATDADATDADATDADATDADATDADATDADATDADATDADATDADATDADATDADATDADATDADATDADATDADATDADATDADATDADATDADATDADATDADATDADATDADATDADADATDADATDADATDADATDADATDADATDADATDADATDADATDADATDADATDADATDADATDADATDADATDADADATDADATDADATDGGETSQARASVTQQRIVRGPGATQTVLVTGFQPGETVSATVFSTPFDLTPVTADASGNARLAFAVGSDFELGQHRVEVRGSVTGELPADRENTAFQVVERVVERGLAVTGGPTDGLLLGGVGALFLLSGSLAWGLRRRSTAE